MKKILIIFSLALATTAMNFSFAQNAAPASAQPSKTNTTSQPATKVFTTVDEMPQFPGGEQKLNQFLKDNVQYPKEAMDAKKEGKVYVSFVVNETGKITDVKMLQRQAFGMDQEAMRVVKLMPDWIPGKQNGQPVAVQYTLPIHFALGNTQAK